MISTADKVRMVLESDYGFKRERSGEYRGNNPFKHDSDSHGFVVKFDDGEHGAFFNHAGDDSGSLYELAQRLNIDIPEHNRAQVENSKTTYASLADYATRHYAPEDVFVKAGWKFERIHNRAAITWQAATGKRVRFVDKQGESEFMWIGGGINCWYGLDRAITIASNHSLPLILCNGEASTVVAQHHGLPAFCGCGGEGAISDDMKKALGEKWQGEIVIALDCDEKGRAAAAKVQTFLERGLIIDLELSEKGDLADFCGLHGSSVLNAVKRLILTSKTPSTLDSTSIIEFVSSKAVLSDFTRFVYDEPTAFGRTIRMPFPTFRQAGGFANIMTTKKVWVIGNKSGDGKTILSETLCDEFTALGHNVVYIGDEWSTMELNARMIQRAYRGNTPLTYEMFLQRANGNYDFTQQQEIDIALAMRCIRERRGETIYMNLNADVAAHNPNQSVVFLEDIMLALQHKIREYKARGQTIDIVIIDYLSLYDTKGDANNLEEYKMGVFKSYCKSLDVLGITTVQVKKESEDRVTDRGGMLNAHDLYFLRPDKANLITTMNRVYTPRFIADKKLNARDSIKPLLDENGQADPTPNFAMLIVKNSIGKAHFYTYFHMDYEHLVVREGLHPDYYFDSYYQYPVHKMYRE